MRRVVEISTLAVLGSMSTRGSDYLVRQPLNKISLSFLTPCLYHAPRKGGRGGSGREDKVTSAKIRGRRGKRHREWENWRIEPKIGRESNSEDGGREHKLSNSKTEARIKGGKQVTARMI